MRLKLGECELAAACYERLLAGETLSETAWYMAAVAIAEQRAAEPRSRRRGARARWQARSGGRTCPSVDRAPAAVAAASTAARVTVAAFVRADRQAEGGLLDAGAVTEDEFEQKKAELLERLISK